MSDYYRQGPQRPGGVNIGVPGMTPVVRGLIIACVSVWVVQLVALKMGIELSRIFGVVPYGVLHGRIWQPVTYMFLHTTQGLFHLLFNMLMLWMFGSDLERYWGGRGFLRFYLVAGVGAGLFAVALGLISEGMSRVATIGASGAVYGLIIAFGMIYAERTILFMMIFPMKARTMAMILFGVSFLYTFTEPGSGVAHVAHLGGAVVGFLYLKRAWRVGDFYRELRWRIKRRRFRVMRSKDGNGSPDDFDRWVN
ncbi:MAG: rhomboid family intramembrane serine protease [bacterium]|nr:rhomboid family intramembrane serine protease [bacterium]